MATYRPVANRGKKGQVWRRRKPWLARVRIDGQHVTLGYFADKDTAAQEEREYKDAYAR